MIIVRVIGGLGNQLFQYALGRRLTYDNDEQLGLDISWFPKERENHSDLTFKLDKFNTSYSTVTERDVNDVIFGGRSGTDLARRFCRYCPAAVQYITNYHLEIQKNYMVPHIPSVCEVGVPKGFMFEPSIQDISNNAYLDGFWQTEKYFAGIKRTIKSDLSVPQPLTHGSRKIANRIAETNSVGLHVRRGEYVELGFDLPTSYYKSAASVIASKEPEPHFFVFSDGIEWVKNNLSISHPTTYVSNEYSNTDYDDLQLMSLCDQNIISNSTFSWWGAWLGEQPSQTIIAPSVWLMDQATRELDIVPDRWDIVDAT